jgi:hypothetical protein
MYIKMNSNIWRGQNILYTSKSKILVTKLPNKRNEW